MNLQEILSLAVASGVQLLVDGDRLIYRAPRGAMTQELRDAVALNKPALIALLKRSGAPEPATPIERSAAPDADPAPLSPGQERLWLIDRAIDSPLYNVHVGLRWRAPLDRGILERSLEGLVARHAALRTTFPEVDGQPRAVISSEPPVELRHFDLRDYVPEVRERAVARLARAHRRARFDLARGPLTRLAVLTLADDDHLLLVTQHHIITDGWSMGLFLTELGERYRAIATGGQLSRPEPSLRYADYARWQHRRRDQPSHGQALAWWREHLAGLPRLELCHARAPSRSPSHDGDAYSFALPASLTARLKELARAQRTTLYGVLLSAWAILLHLYSDQVDLGVGTVSSGRDRNELRDLIGFLVNTLVLRCDLSGDPSVAMIIARLSAELESARAHEVPFGDVVNAVGALRSASLNPLIQAALVLENAPPPDITRSGNNWEMMLEKLNGGIEGTAVFDLQLVVRDRGDALDISLDYATELFDPEIIERMAGHLCTVFDAMAARPDARLSELSLISELERTRLLREWNATAMDLGEARCAHELFEAQVARTPGAVALVAAGERLTFLELERRANQAARYLSKLGVGPDVPVGLCLTERNTALIVWMMAILKAGGGYVAVDARQPRARVCQMLVDAGVRFAIGDADMAAALSQAAITTVAVDRDAAAIAEESEARLPNPARPNHLAYVIFTSGSTGKPKGVAIEHRQLFNYLRAVSERMALPEDCSYAHVSAFAADLGHTAMFSPLCFGGCLHLVAQDLLSDPQGLGAYFQAAGGIDCFMIVPSHLLALMSGPNPVRLLPRRLLMLAGETLTWELVEQVRALAPSLRMINVYGPTETTVSVLMFDVPARPMAGTTTVPLGRWLPNTRGYVLDRAGRPVPLGARGELFIGGVQVGRGYVGQPQLTAERFVRDPFDPAPDARVYRTGDIVRLLPSGDVEFLGRADHQVKIRGFRVELGEIEAMLMKHPAVRACVVIPHPPSGVESRLAMDTRLVAYVVLAEAGIAPDDLRQHLAERLPDYMVPPWFVVLDQMPLGPNGKLDRKKLPVPDLGSRAAGPGPRDAMETAIASIWQDVLRVDAVAVDQTFFELGGHSLLMMKVQAGLQDRLQVTLSLSELFAHPTIEALARRVAAAVPGAAPPGGGGRAVLAPAPEDSARTAPAAGTSPVLVELKRGRPDREPLVLVHQAGGIEIAYYALAAHLEPDQPVYAIRAALDGMDRCIERLAARYIEMLRARWPDGRWLLGGASFGGVVVYEMAQQLQHQQVQSGPVVLLDSEVPGQVRTPQTLEEIVQFLHHLSPELAEMLMTPRAMRSAEINELVPDGDVFLRNFQDCTALLARYRTRPYTGDVVFVRASDRRRSASLDPEAHWAPLVQGRFTVVQVPGDHFTMLQNPHVETLARQIASLTSDHAAPNRIEPQPRTSPADLLSAADRRGGRTALLP